MTAPHITRKKEVGELSLALISRHTPLQRPSIGGESFRYIGEEIRHIGEEIRTFGKEIRIYGEEIRILGEEIRASGT